MRRCSRRIVVLEKGEQRFVFLIEDDAMHRLLFEAQLGRMAADDDLDFTWFDAARLRSEWDVVTKTKGAAK